MKQLKQPKKFYNRIEAMERIQELTGYQFTYRTMVNWEERGFINVAGYIGNGKRDMPVYTDETIETFLNKMPALRRDGKIHTKKYKGRQKKGDPRLKSEREQLRQEKIKHLKDLAHEGKVYWSDDFPGYLDD